MKKLKLGVFGFGVVGHGLYEVLNQTKGINAEIVKFGVKHPHKPRSIDMKYFTFDKNEILNNPDLDVIVELIDNADEAFEIVRAALKNGKAVVSANKKMIAEHFEELYQIQQETSSPLLYEGSVCGAIPIIRNLEEYYDNDFLSSLEGICNGTTNYILTKTALEGLSYPEALKQAQELGFAESNPTLDVKAFDPKYKLAILVAHTFGLFVKPEHIFNFGIQNLNDSDNAFAREKGFRIKLIAHTSKVDDRISAFVLPKFIRPNEMIFNVNNEFNAVAVEALFSDRQFFLGKGAGSHPTGSAVLSDVSALSYGYRYGYKKVTQVNGTQFDNDKLVSVYFRYNDPNILSEIRFEEITERYQSPKTNYVIGSLPISELIRLDLNNRVDVFVGVI
jgi:homoserine dehydrogenase